MELDDSYILWDKPQVKKILGICDSSVYKLVKLGQLKPLKVGGRTFWRKSDVLAFIDRQSEC